MKLAGPQSITDGKIGGGPVKNAEGPMKTSLFQYLKSLKNYSGNVNIKDGQIDRLQDRGMDGCKEWQYPFEQMAAEGKMKPLPEPMLTWDYKWKQLSIFLVSKI